MAVGVVGLLLSFVYVLMTCLVYFTKKRIDNIENKLYSYLIFVTFIGIFLELGCIYSVPRISKLGVATDIINKSYLIYIITWCYFFTQYMLSISFKGKTNLHLFVNKHRTFITKFFFNFLYLCFFIGIIILPIQYYNDGMYVFSHGRSVEVVYLASAVYIMIWVFILLFNVKNVGMKKFIPLLTFIFGAVLNMIIHNVNPGILLITITQAFITVMMFYTIENPDVAMLEQIEVQKERAEKANTAKSDFLSSMSHEIRTPLNAIVGFSECINQSETLEEAKENARDVMSASQTLLEIVNGILDISKIESGKIELVENDYDPYKMIDETVKLARGRLGEKPLDFNVNIAPDIPKVLFGDKFNIKKIVLNLLTNAIKYTDEGFVNFDVHGVKLNGYERLIFTVADSGRGIKKEDVSKLFTKFQRLDEEKNQTIEGTGLGLAITKQLIDMMKGNIVVESTYGEGSKFTVAIDQKISDVVLDDTTSQLNVVIDLTGKKILVVDDNKLNLKVADKLLKNYNVAVTLCNSGHDCIELIEMGNKYDLILLDDMMPNMSGTETLIHLKDNASFNIPVIALTANAINGMKEKYLEAGFDGYLAKPIDKNELYRTLAKFLNTTATYEADSNSMVITPEEEKKDDKITQDPNVPRITKDIPKYTPDNAEIVVKPGDKEVKEEKKEDKPTKVKSSRKASTRATDKPKILIVDDNNLNIKVETKLINSLGYDVESAYSGIEAIKMIEQTKYDLIFMDIMMPIMDGVKTLTELKELEGFDTPTIALTADAVLGAKEKYLSYGFDEYVTKPINKNELEKLINKYIVKK